MKIRPFSVIGTEVVLYRLTKTLSLQFFAIAASVLLLSSFPSNVLADSFYPNADSIDCNFAQASSISIKSTPQNKSAVTTYATAEHGIKFDQSKIKGEGDGYIQSHTMLSVADMLYPNARRYLGVADKVSAPPGTKIEFGYYYFNYAGHSVYGKDIQLFLSSDYGDLTKLITPSDGSTSLINGNIDFKLLGNIINRRGLSFVYPLNQNLPVTSWSNPPFGISIGQFTVKDPLDVSMDPLSYKFSDSGDLLVDVRIYVRNQSQYPQNNINLKYEYRNEMQNRINLYQDILAGDFKTFEFQINAGQSNIEDYEFGHFDLINPNSNSECAVHGVPTGIISSNPNTRMLAITRNDSNSPVNWFGVQEDFAFSPEGSAMCIERIPYTTLNRLPSVNIKKRINGQSILSSMQCEQNFTSHLEVYNSSVGLGNLHLEYLYNSEVGIPVSMCEGVIVDNSSMVCDDGSKCDKKVIWDIQNFKHNQSWSCDILWNVTPVLNINSVDTAKRRSTFDLHFCYGYNNLECEFIAQSEPEIDESHCLAISVENPTLIIPSGGTAQTNINILNNSVSNYIINIDGPISIENIVCSINSNNCVHTVENIPAGVSVWPVTFEDKRENRSVPLNATICLDFLLNDFNLDQKCIDILILGDIFSPLISNILSQDPTIDIAEIPDSFITVNFPDELTDFAEKMKFQSNNAPVQNTNLVNTGTDITLYILLGGSIICFVFGLRIVRLSKRFVRT